MNTNQSEIQEEIPQEEIKIEDIPKEILDSILDNLLEERNLEEDAYIVWVNINQIDKTIRAYDSPYREELEKAYRSMVDIYVIEELNSAFIFDKIFMQIPLNYYTKIYLWLEILMIH